MNPVLSWTILFVIVLGYLAVNGVPRSIPRPLNQESDNLGGSSKRNKKQARNEPSRRDSKTNSDNGHGSGSESQRTQSSKTTSNKLVMNGKNADHDDMLAKSQAKQSISKKSTVDNRLAQPTPRSEDVHDSDDPVENVMNGRPRKTSTPIGMRSGKLATMNGSFRSPVMSSTSGNEAEQESPMSYVESRQVTRSHATDDMLPAHNNTLPRTLKIVPSTHTNGHTMTASQKPKKADEKLTKKQRQNAAKKLKAKAEKAETEERQAAALRLHKKTREAQRFAEQTNKSSSTFTSGMNNAWDQQDWKTVSKNKKSTSVEALPATSADALIWDA